MSTDAGSTIPGAPRRISPRLLGLIVLLTVIWGTNWPLFVWATREVSVWTFRAVALTAGGLLLLLLAAMRGAPLRVPRAHWGTLATVTVVFLFVWNACTTFAAVMIPSGQAAVLAYTMPLWSALIGWAALGERLNGRLLLALALGAAAVLLLMVPGLDRYSQAPLGIALGLAAGLGWGLGTQILKHRPVPIPILVLTGWQMLAVGLLFVPFALGLAEGGWFMPDWPSILVIAYITLVPLALGTATWFAIAEQLPANVAGLSAILVPVVAMASGALVHGEPLGPLQLAAIACSAAALWLALLKPRRSEPARFRAT